MTTTTVPQDRYSPAVRIETPITSHGTGFSPEGLDVAGYRRVCSTISHQLPATSDQPSSLVHFTGVHLWNLPLVWALRRRGVPVVHTLHDLHPHGGVRHGGLIRLWNRLIIGSGAHILVHGRRYRDELLARGVPEGRVTYLPLLHGFWGFADFEFRNSQFAIRNSQFVLFFGRVEAYKGVDVLLAAWEQVGPHAPGARLVIAGQRARGGTLPALPPGVEWRDRRIEDGEAIDLFRSASVLVLPYRDATQSALIAAAYAFETPVIVTETGALPEYVVEGETGWIVPPADAAALAAALREALADPERLRSMGRAGRAWFEAQRKLEEAARTAMYQEVPGSNS